MRALMLAEPVIYRLPNEHLGLHGKQVFLAALVAQVNDDADPPTYDLVTFPAHGWTSIRRVDGVQQGGDPGQVASHYDYHRSITPPEASAPAAPGTAEFPSETLEPTPGSTGGGVDGGVGAAGGAAAPASTSAAAAAPADAAPGAPASPAEPAPAAPAAPAEPAAAPPAA